MRILFLTQWFEPEPAFKGTMFVEELIARGHEVNVATGFPNYPGGQIYPGYKLRPFRRERKDKFWIDRILLWPSHNKSAIGRAVNYISFFVSALIYCLINMRRYDVVYVYHPPITPAAAAAMAGFVTRVPFIVDIQDLWPDSVLVSDMGSKNVGTLLHRLCRFVYRRAAHIIVQSNGIGGILEDRGVPSEKITRIYNWSNYQPPADNDPEISDLIATHLKNRLNIVYGGNIGQAQGLDTLVSATISASEIVPGIRLHIFGNGIERNEIAALAQASDGAVVLHDGVSRALMDRIFDEADILALHLRNDPLFSITVPSKTQHYLSVGKPILAGIDGEAGQLIVQSGGGLVSNPGDISALAENIVHLARKSPAERQAMGKLSRNYYNLHLAMQAAMDKTCAILEKY